MTIEKKKVVIFFFSFDY